jgi:hypothetical protein
MEKNLQTNLLWIYDLNCFIKFWQIARNTIYDVIFLTHAH